LVAYTDELGDSFGYAYDMAGNLKALTYPGGKVISYSYDANNRLSTVTDWKGRVTTYNYDENGRLSATWFPNQTFEIRTYDLSGKLTALQLYGPQINTIYSCSNQIDASGRITAEIVSPAPASSGVPAATMSFDADNRLTAFNGLGVFFDPDGNMTTGPAVQTQLPTTCSYDGLQRRGLFVQS